MFNKALFWIFVWFVKNMKAKIVLFYLLQKNISIELHIVQTLNPFPLQYGEVDTTV